MQRPVSQAMDVYVRTQRHHLASLSLMGISVSAQPSLWSYFWLICAQHCQNLDAWMGPSCPQCSSFPAYLQPFLKAIPGQAPVPAWNTTKLLGTVGGPFYWPVVLPAVLSRTDQPIFGSLQCPTPWPQGCCWVTLCPDVILSLLYSRKVSSAWKEHCWPLPKPWQKKTQVVWENKSSNSGACFRMPLSISNGC